MRRARLLGIVTLGTLLLLGAGAEAQPAGSAQVVLARPPAEVIARGQTGAQPLTKGARLGQGDRVRTGRGGAAEILLGDGSLVRLAELSELEIDRLDVDAAGTPTTSRFNLATGAARAWVARQVIARVSATQGGFSVQTPTAVAAVRQTDFAVFQDAAAVTRVYIFAGGVQTTSNGAGSVLCFRNRWTRVQPGRDPEACRVIPLRDKRAVLKLVQFESATVDPGDLDQSAFDSLGAKLGQSVTGVKVWSGPSQEGRPDAAAHEAPVSTGVGVE
jgi:FecR protein